MHIILRYICNNKAHRLGSELYSSDAIDKAIYLFFYVNVKTTSPLCQMGEKWLSYPIVSL